MYILKQPFQYINVSFGRKISRDSTVYEDASTFNPNRFIDNPDILEFVFGFGRRICPGNYLAYEIVWIFMVSVLWGFEMRRPQGEPPLDRDLDRFELGLIRYVFTATILPCITDSMVRSPVILFHSDVISFREKGWIGKKRRSNVRVGQILL